MNYIKLLKELEELTNWNDHNTARLKLADAMLTQITKHKQDYDTQVSVTLNDIKQLQKLDDLQDRVSGVREVYATIKKWHERMGYMSSDFRKTRDIADKILWQLLNKVCPIQAVALWGAL